MAVSRATQGVEKSGSPTPKEITSSMLEARSKNLRIPERGNSEAALARGFKDAVSVESLFIVYRCSGSAFFLDWRLSMKFLVGVNSAKNYGAITNLLSLSGSSNKAYSSLYLRSRKCVSVPVTPSMVAMFSATKLAS